MTLTLRQVVYGFGCIPLCIVGLVGNMFSLLVLYPSKYNKTKGLFYGYLGVLSVTDIVWLLLNLTFSIFQVLGRYDYTHNRTAHSKHEVSINAIIDNAREGFSGPCDLMICFGTFHRLANVNTSLNSKTLDAKKEKRNLLAAVFLSYVVSGAFYIPSFYKGFETIEIWKLNGTEANYIYLPKGGPWHVYGFFCVVIMRIGPLTAIFIMNMIMIYKLNNLKLRKRYTRNRGLFSISRIVSDTETSTTTGIKSSNHIKKLTKEIKIGKVLVLISTTYLFFTLPHTIDLTIYMSLVSLDAGEGRGIQYFDKDYNIFCNLLWTCNYSLNFYFYCMINQDIRKISIDFIKKHFKFPNVGCHSSTSLN